MSILKAFDFTNPIVKLDFSFFYGSDRRHPYELAHHIWVALIESVVKEIVSRCLVKHFKNQSNLADIIRIVDVNKSSHVPYKDADGKFGKT